jgi:hypothetical protein
VRATTGKHAGQDLGVVGRAAVLGELALEVAVQGLRLLERLAGGEDHLGPARREVLAVLGGAGLDQHRVALRRARDVERPAHREELALVIEDVELVGIEVAPRRLVVEERVVLPRIPQAGDDLHELAGAAVARGVIGLAVEVEVLRLGVGHRGDDVPRGAPTAQVIERRVLAGDVERLVVRRRAGRGEAEPVGDGGERGQERQRLEVDHPALAAELVLVLVVGADADAVRQEHHVELAALGGLRERRVVLEIEAAVGARVGMAPGGDVVTGGGEEGSEVHLAGHGVALGERVRRGVPARNARMSSAASRK